MAGSNGRVVTAGADEATYASATAVPPVGSTWQDAGGRELTVDYVSVGDRAGREVRGRVLCRDGQERPYATTLLMWASIWRDRKPFVKVRQ